MASRRVGLDQGDSLLYEWLCFKKYLFKTENIIFQINPNDSDFAFFDDFLTNKRWSDTKWLGGKIREIVVFNTGNSRISIDKHTGTLYIYRSPFMLNKYMQSTLYMNYYINELINLIRNNNSVTTQVLTQYRP